jgi:hypothetical protein
MFVTPTRRKALGAAILGTLAVGACDDPEASTDLRPAGPPEVLAVLVFNDTVNEAIESATYCKKDDPKRPGKVGIPAYGLSPVVCPVDGSEVSMLTDAWPDRWYIRIVFDELLDPDIETLDPILDAMGNPTDTYHGSLATTQPVTLKCQGVDGTTLLDVEYDGYYSPAGNAVTWPVGPSLVIQPLDPTIVPVESVCEVALKQIVRDKDGNSAEGRDLQPFRFQIAPVTVIASGPGDGDEISPATGGVEIDFNVSVDPAEAFCTDIGDATCGGDASKIFTLTVGDPAVPAEGAYVENFESGLFIGADIIGGQTYSWTPPEGFKIKDKCGRLSTVKDMPEAFSFSTKPSDLISIVPAGGNAVAPSKKILITFNQIVDLATFVEGEDYTIAPRPANFSTVLVGGEPGNPNPFGTQIRLLGDYNLNTNYVLTIKATASISDDYGKQVITFDQDTVANFTTTSAIAITAQSPANGSRVTKKMPTSAVRVQLTFNQEMAAASLCAVTPCASAGDTMPEFTLVRTDGMPVTVAPVVSASGAALRVDHPGLPAGTYKFTLKQGATIADKIAPTPNVYTQPLDRVITFTVAEGPPAGPDFRCLGDTTP